MALTFPSNPHAGDHITADNGVKYTYDGEKWVGQAQSTVVTVTAPANIQIVIKNLSTAVTNEEVKAAVAATQIQINRDWAPIWSSTADLTFISVETPIPAGSWPVYILDDSNVAGQLGYHNFTGAGVPSGRVFAQECIDLGYSWTVTLSHEILEMMADPFINLSAENNGDFYAFEVSDACEADQYAYSINGILVSDFVTPAWFNRTQIAQGTQYDFQNLITAPFQVLLDGYISKFDFASNRWATITHGNVVVPDEDNNSGRNRITR
jgi:hypothetical protein